MFRQIMEHNNNLYEWKNILGIMKIGITSHQGNPEEVASGHCLGNSEGTHSSQSKPKNRSSYKHSSNSMYMLTA
jgi:hypothetical protein